MTRPDDFRAAAARLDEPVTGITDADRADGSIDEALVWSALSTVIDPEIGLDIVTLGLVYQVTLLGDAVQVTYSLTTPGCPMEGVITGGIESAVTAVPGVRTVLPDLVWEPRWDPGMMREGAW